MIEQLIWLVPAAVLGAGLGSPRGGLLVLAACLPLFGSPPGGPYGGALDVAALAAIGTAWRAGRAPRSRLDWPVWAFLAVTAASLIPLAYAPPSWQPRILARLVAALASVEPWTPLYGWRALVNLAVGIGLYFAVRRAFAGRSPRPLLLALSVGVAATLAIGMLEQTGVLGLELFRVKGGPVWQTRLHSLFFHSGWLAEYLVVSVPVSAAALAGLRRRGTEAAAVMAALAALTVFLSQQRGGWFTALGQLSLGAALGGRSILRTPLVRRALVAGLASALIVAGVGLAVKPDLFAAAAERTRDAFSGHSRLFIWDVTAEMTAARPVLGWGAGSFSPVYHQILATPRPGWFDWLTAHNQYLMLTAERGLLGLAGFGLLLWALGESLFAASRAGAERVLVRGLTLSFAGFVAYGMFQYMFFLKAIEWLFWLLVGALAAMTPAAGPRPLERASQALLLIAALLVPWRAAAVEPMRVPGDRAFGFHHFEKSGDRTFQWTEGYAVRRMNRPKGASELELALANGHPRPDLHPLEVVVRVDGREALRADVGGGWTSYRLPLQPDARAEALVEITARPTFRPFSDFRRYPEIGASTDVRRLGVAVSWGRR